MAENNYPQDDDKTIYLENHLGMGVSLAYIIEKVKEKWPNVEMENIDIEAEHRHVTCLTYDQYDPTDYQDYIIIKLKH